MIVILLASLIMVLLACLMAWILGWANRAFHVEVDPRVSAVLDALPGANCGACGYVGCGEYAEAAASGEAPPDLCPVGGDSCAQAVAEILGIEVGQKLPFRPVVHCGATYDKRLIHSEYRGEPSCRSANLVGGVQACTYGCLGFGDCERSCPFDAIHVIDGLARVDYEKCTGCGACARVCPRNIIHMIPFKSERVMVVACSNHDPGKYVRQVCKVGCIGCGMCARKSDLFRVEDNLAHIDYDQYDPESMDEAQLALEKCPMNGILYIGEPGPEELEQTDGEDVGEPVRDEFQTTVDDTEWHG
ncbi:RnfABCDGE type electron transport complex subunit B [Kiritimatiella glycovorans]|uniref:Ion-translocating oxidoreductase complex subunit B n=1 Tax=Kiritimatiella glycovorans TaxID=1307763 RepID=A0A0G3EJW3_9BACT|nr:RnfABCDGE type electron transport complex subunit B [Kiritimatiella glycovorans]AKJ64419.1 Nitrogen fixation protein rnfB [Kiritimatiella glycovorans]